MGGERKHEVDRTGKRKTGVSARGDVWLKVLEID